MVRDFSGTVRRKRILKQGVQRAFRTKKKKRYFKSFILEFLFAKIGSKILFKEF